MVVEEVEVDIEERRDGVVDVIIVGVGVVGLVLVYVFVKVYLCM